MQEDLNTLEGARAFLRRIRDEAQSRGLITVTPQEFVRAVELGALEYLTPFKGGNHLAEYAPHMAGRPVAITLVRSRHADHV